MVSKLKREQLIERALANPQIADFELFREDIEKNIISIHKIFKTQDQCKASSDPNRCGSDGFHFKLIKDRIGKISLVTYPCPKNLLNNGYLIKQNFIYSSVNLSEQQQLLNPKDISITNINEQQDRTKLVNFLLKIKKQTISTKGLYVYGAAGVGKSHIIIAFCNEMAIHNKKVAYLTMNNFSLDVMQMVRQQKDLTDLIENLKTADILVFDELGSEKYNTYVHNQILYSILNFRLHTNKITIFSSKFDLSDLKKVYKISNFDKNIDGFIERIVNICNDNRFFLKK